MVKNKAGIAAPVFSSQTVPCPLCSSEKNIEVQRQQLALTDLGTIDIGFGYCETCGHIYQLRRISDELLLKHYTCYSNYTCFESDIARTLEPSKVAKRLLNLTQAHTTKNTIYEVGCATGKNLYHFQKAGWNVGGCEPSPKAVQQAKNIFGIEIDCGTDEQILPNKKNLDLILFAHVLEHLTNPLASLKHAYNALHENGLVLIEVPCAIAPDLLLPGWFQLEHLHYFSEASLNKLLNLAGFSLIEFRINLPDSIYPVITAIASKSPHPVSFDSDELAVFKSRDFLEKFIAHDKKNWLKAIKRLEHVCGPLYIWGAGIHTAQLFYFTPIYQQVLGIIDRDNQKWGKYQAEHAIMSPDDFFANKKDIPVLISSYVSEADIAKKLLAGGISENNIVRLYT